MVLLPEADIQMPGSADLTADLEMWRRHGVLRLKNLRLPALGRAALAAGLATTSIEASQPAVLIELVRCGLATIAGSLSGRCALVLLGLDPNTFDLAPHLLREDAAEIYGVSLERFRRQPQLQVLTAVADTILELCVAHRARVNRLAMERRHPADSRLAIHWLERFEIYFAIWSPLYGMAADITAYRETLLDREHPWDRAAGTGGHDDAGYSQEAQAAGYSDFGLFHLASALAAEQKFVTRFGGLWLLSSAQAEVEARNALYLVRQRGPMNERDHSWLRELIEQTHGEVHSFLGRLRADRIGQATIVEWNDWLSACSCNWQGDEYDASVEYHPTARYVPGIRPDCTVHQVVESCSAFCGLIEHEWLKVADFYKTPPNLQQTTL